MAIGKQTGSGEMGKKFYLPLPTLSPFLYEANVTSPSSLTLGEIKPTGAK
ncbi:hypothetical protein NOS3756_15250 [Nostoc sp. NIES-3756]|nr:hypothetical protein NOS3756_15250 [Nostoc sp. NIES-3756]BAY39726.1 hypothetical protein NIES2111_41030 [Nostoc sp. NIES-2111]